MPKVSGHLRDCFVCCVGILTISCVGILIVVMIAHATVVCYSYEYSNADSPLKER
jgi:hypothetical protein